MTIPYKNFGFKKEGDLHEFLEGLSPDIFVETGTDKARTIIFLLSLHTHFKKIHSIELQEDRQAYNSQYLPSQITAAKEQAPEWEEPDIDLHIGPSQEVLPEILQNITTPTVFFLDAHHSGEGSGGEEYSLEEIIENELHTILTHTVPNHPIIIDDVNQDFAETRLLKIFKQHNALSSYHLHLTEEATEEGRASWPWGDELFSNLTRKDKLLICIPKKSQ